MKRTFRLLAAVLGVAGLVTGVAVAASSPTVATRPAGPIGVSSAVLRGAVNPHGVETGYVFDYGLTAAYGLQSASHTVGHQNKLVAVKAGIAGLQPGTVYHYRISALSSAGSAFGVDHAFKTKGAPPASVVTGPAVNVGKNEATPTGSINPEGERTTWYVQYVQSGPPAFYTSRSIGQTDLAALKTPLPVQVQLTGLAPGKVYHYRFVASHPTFTSFGADAAFFTQPGFKRRPNMTTRTSPKRASRKPYVFTTAGTLHGANFIPSNLRCTGRVGIRYFNGSHQVAFNLVQVGSDCKFSTQVLFKRLINGHRTNLHVDIFYRGNGYLKSTSKTDHNISLG
jgi:phosphodiesterase/alkaline phosphatase D-like protein